MENRPVLRELLRTEGVKTAGKAVKYISPTHIALFDMCPRRWYFRYICGVKDPQGAGAEFGQKGHSLIEKYLVDGTPIPWDTDEGASALAGIDHWPSRDDVRSGAVCVEKEILIHRNALPIPYYGVVDLLYMDEAGADDHKFSSDPAKWGATAEQLKYDYQGIIYSAGALSIGAKARKDKRTGQEYVRFGHLQYRMRAPHKVIPVRVGIPVQHIMDELDKLDKTVLEMLKVGQIARPEDTPYKEGANSCDKYGREGCYYREVCSAAGVAKAVQDPVARSMAKITYGGELNMANALSTMDRLRRNREAAASAPINPPDGFPASDPIPPADLRVAEPNEAAAAEGERIVAEKADAKAAERAEKAAAKEAARRPSSIMLPCRPRGGAAVEAAPAQESAAPAQKVVTAVDDVDADSPLGKARAALALANSKVEQCAALLDEAQNGEDDDEIEQARSNLAFAEKKLSKATAAVEEAEAQHKAAIEEAKAREAARVAEAEKKAAAQKKEMQRSQVPDVKGEDAVLVVDASHNFLYLGCRPRRTLATMWEDFIKPVTDRIEKATNTPFWRLRGHDSQAVLVQEIRVMLAEGSLVLPQHLAIEPYGGNHVQVAEFLIPLYAEVISA